MKSSTNRAPRKAQPGEPGESGTYEIELKVLADVGLVGMPNAGKSTLLSCISSARPKIADYPFTTLEPKLGIVKYGNYNSFVMADIPGLIKGASSGKGLGHKFLKHIERNKILLYLIDSQDKTPVKTFNTLKKELLQINADLGIKPFYVCRTKSDLQIEISEEWEEFSDDIIKPRLFQFCQISYSDFKNFSNNIRCISCAAPEPKIINFSSFKQATVKSP